MSSHILWMVVFAGLVSTVFAVLLRDEPAQQWRTFGRLFGGFVVAGLALGWLMYPMPF